ncbi:MAG: diguanylate cyclase [Alteromonadaceae bacterium]|nr:diguanylate cyclase [Alteromonadaceae bacterium]
MLLFPWMPHKNSFRYSQKYKIFLCNDLALASTSFYEISEPVTLGIGIANTQAKDNASLDSLIKAADVQLYNAKHQGRNCIRTDNR